MIHQSETPEAGGTVSAGNDDGQSPAELRIKLQETEEALRQSREMLRLAMSAAKLGSWERDLKTGVMRCSPAYMANLGLDPGDTLTYDRLQAIRHPDDAERVNRTVEAAIATRSDYEVEYRVIRPDGSIGKVIARGRAIYDHGEPVRMVGITFDVTEQVRAEGILRDAQRQQEFLLDLNDQLRGIEDPYAIMDAAVERLARFIGADRIGYGEVHDDDRQELVIQRSWTRDGESTPVGRYRLDQFPPELFAALRQGQTVVVPSIEHDPRFADPAVRANYAAVGAKSLLNVPMLKNGRLTAMLYVNTAEPRAWSAEEISLVEDVAERTWTAVERAWAEASLRESETRFRIIAEALPALVWTINPSLRMTYANARWSNYLGVPPEEALGYAWKEHIHPDDLARMIVDLEDIRRKEEPYTAEVRYRAADGGYHWHVIRAAPLLSSRGVFQGWCGTSVDIHDLKETEAALRESEERLALAQRAARIGVFDWDVASGRVTWTWEQERLFGMEPGTFSGRVEDWSSRVLPGGFEAAQKAIADTVARRDRDVEFAYRIRWPDGAIRNLKGSAMIFYAPDGSARRIVGVNLDVTESQHAEERQQLLIRELHHRVKNTLATVQAIVGSTARTAANIEEFYQAFVGRIVSLARTHNLLTEDIWQKASLGELVRTELGPYDNDHRNRVVIEGPDLELHSEAAVPIGMAIHELTTNAAKHGALSTFGGQVDVRWEVDRNDDKPLLHFAWTERGGPRVQTPTRQGFGSRLLQRVLSAQLEANVHMDFDESGLRFTMAMPIRGAPALFRPDH